MTGRDRSLDGAYGLGGTEEARELYDGWAETYDADFARAMDFVAPREVARIFAEAGGRGPVLDFGCGTGLLGEELSALGIGPVDGVDISAGMLRAAQAKRVYRHLSLGDVLAGHVPQGGPWQGVVSSGTFTLGHVGPEGLAPLIDLAAPGAVFALSVNRAHFEAEAFAETLAGLAGQIEGLALPEVRFYGPGATGPHKDDTGFVATFRKRS